MGNYFREKNDEKSVFLGKKKGYSGTKTCVNGRLSSYGHELVIKGQRIAVLKDTRLLR